MVGSRLKIWQKSADVAQLVEQPFRKWQVVGSNPPIGLWKVRPIYEVADKAVSVRHHKEKYNFCQNQEIFGVEALFKAKVS